MSFTRNEPHQYQDASRGGRPRSRAALRKGRGARELRPPPALGHAGVVSRYAEAKPYVVPQSLAELTGPAQGQVRLPRHIDWGPEYSYDLADVADVSVMYERVIREARSADDLSAHLVLQRVLG